MSIQYRCRCGQEVTLRTREPLYLVMSLLLGISILNTAFVVVLWYRLAGSEERAGVPPIAEVKLPAAAPVAASDSEGASEATGSIVLNMPPPSLDGVKIPISFPDQPSGVELESTSAPSASPPPPSTAISVEAVAPAPAAFEFSPPAGIAGISLLTLLTLPLESDLECAAVRVAACAWGSGPARSRAREQLADDDSMRNLLPIFDQALPSGPQPGATLRLTAGNETPAAALDLLARLRKEWAFLWERLELRAASPGGADKRIPDGIQDWVAAAGAFGREPVDFLLLLDLSDSMEEDLPRFREVLTVIAPLATTADGSTRWGFVGYRDDIVTTLPLDPNVDRMLECASKWTAGGGGDVPEGVDQAIFEALRLGSFKWRPDAQHRVMIVGDAPPPYERISSMLTFVEGAHQSPERYLFSCVGILREAGFAEVPSFRAIAERGGGAVSFLPPATSLFAPIWQWVFGKPPPSRLDPPF